MNILILAKDSHVGGLVNCTDNLAQGLIKTHQANISIGITPSDAVEPLRKYNFYLIDFDTKNPLTAIKSYRLISKIVNEQKIDIIHTQNRIPALYAAVYCFFHRRIKYIWANHVVPIPSDFFHRITTRYGSLAVTEGLAGKKMLVEDFKIPEEKVRIINEGINLQHFKPISKEEQAKLKEEIGVKEGEKLILLYGRLAPIKGHLFLLDALKKVKNRSFKVVFPGEDHSDYINQVRNKIMEGNLENNIVFPGYINGRDYLSISDLMVLPSINEGFPLSCVEAYSMGVPVIRTKTGGYDDTQDMCFGVDYGDVDALSALLNAFMSGDDKFRKMALCAKENVKRLSLENMAEEYYAVYESIIDKK